MDRYRIQGLVSLLSSGKLTPQQVVWTTREVIRKANILVSGYTKRGKLKEANEYKKIIMTYA